MESDNAATSALANTIKRIVQDSWASTERPLLLSTLGKVLADENPDIKNQLGSQKLGEYIKSELKDEIDLIRSTEKALAVFVVPSNLGLSEADLRRPHSTQRTSKFPRFHYSIWLAFKKQLSGEQVRVLVLRPKVWFEDFPEGHIPNDGEFIISKHDLEADGSPDSICMAITKWADKNQIDIEDLTIAKLGKAPQVETAGTAKSVFDLVISALSPQELARISMPLDVIVKLSNMRA